MNLFSIGRRSSYDLVLPKCKEIEHLLRILGYTGRGVHELVTSAGTALDRDVSRAARKVATIRNKTVHEADFSLDADGLCDFQGSADFVIHELLRLVVRREKALQAARANTRGTKSILSTLAGFAQGAFSALRG